MAGYSGTPLAKKLGIKHGHLVALLNAPPDFEQTLEGLPDAVTLRHGLRGKGPFDVIVLFAERETVLARRFEDAMARLAVNGGLWVGWPKQASRRPTDLSDGAVRALGLSYGLVDNKTCAIDETWSGLRFVVRLADRDAWTSR